MADMGQVVDVYLKIRDARAKLKKEYEAADNKLKESLTTLDNFMLGQLIDTGATSVRTEGGTVFRQEEIKPSASDWSAFYDFIRENNCFDALERRVKKEFVKEYMDTHEGRLPPGISVHKEFAVRVRRSD